MTSTSDFAQLISESRKRASTARRLISENIPFRPLSQGEVRSATQPKTAPKGAFGGPPASSSGGGRTPPAGNIVPGGKESGGKDPRILQALEQLNKEITSQYETATGTDIANTILDFVYENTDPKGSKFSKGLETITTVLKMFGNPTSGPDAWRQKLHIEPNARPARGRESDLKYNLLKYATGKLLTAYGMGVAKYDSGPTSGSATARPERDPFAEGMLPSMATMRLIATADKKLFSSMMESVGLRILGFDVNDPFDKRATLEHVESIANEICEDIHDRIQMHPNLLKLKKSAEGWGFVVGLVF